MKQVLMCKVSSYAIWLVHVTASSVNLRPVSHTLNDVVQECETGRDEGNMHMQFLSCIYINLKKMRERQILSDYGHAVNFVFTATR